MVKYVQKSTWVENLFCRVASTFSPLKTRNGDHENVVKKLKQVQTLHHISQSRCERGQLKIESFQAGSLMYNTKRLFLKTPENILKYTNFIGRNVILNFHKIDIYLLFTKTLKDRPFVPAAAVIFLMTWKKNIYENFKRKLLRGIVNVIKNKSFTKTTNR